MKGQRVGGAPPPIEILPQQPPASQGAGTSNAAFDQMMCAYQSYLNGMGYTVSSCSLCAVALQSFLQLYADFAVVVENKSCNFV